MKKRASLYSFILVSLSMILSSCGGGNSSITNNTFGRDAIMAKERPMNNVERNIATRICYAYQSKSKNFRSSGYIGTNFKFALKYTDCQNNISTNQLTAVLNYDSNNELAYVPTNPSESSALFNKKVQSDISGYLSQVCDKIVSNQAISNTVYFSGYAVQGTFFHDDLDTYILQYFQLQPDNSYKINSAEKLKVRTQVDYKNGEILGMDEFYSTQKLCSIKYDKNINSEFSQSFISR
jgi:hypothetical protein